MRAHTMAGTRRMTAGHLEAGTAGENRILADLALFFTAPFVGLAYIIAFPFLGYAVLAKSLFEAAAAR